MKKRQAYKGISKKLHKAYWQGVIDVVACIGIAMFYVWLFWIGW